MDARAMSGVAIARSALGKLIALIGVQLTKLSRSQAFVSFGRLRYVLPICLDMLVETTNMVFSLGLIEWQDMPLLRELLNTAIPYFLP